jgi:hypothetical protein
MERWKESGNNGRMKNSSFLCFLHWLGVEIRKHSRFTEANKGNEEDAVGPFV